MRYHQYWHSIWHNERPGWESTQGETSWLTAGAVIAALAVGAWTLLALVVGAVDRLVEWLLAGGW